MTCACSSCELELPLLLPPACVLLRITLTSQSWWFSSLSSYDADDVNGAIGALQRKAGTANIHSRMHRCASPTLLPFEIGYESRWVWYGMTWHGIVLHNWYGMVLWYGMTNDRVCMMGKCEISIPGCASPSFEIGYEWVLVSYTYTYVSYCIVGLVWYLAVCRVWFGIYVCIITQFCHFIMTWWSSPSW